MSISVTYHVLFEVKIMHHYFLNRGTVIFDSMSVADQADVMLKYDAREIFEIVPTEECTKILNANHCIFKATSTGIIVGLRAGSDGQAPPKFKPFSSLADDLIFTFIVKLRDFDFMNYTALPFTGNSGQTFVFQNIVSGGPKKYPALTAIAPLYEAAKEYLPGDMLSNNANNPTKLFTALRKTTQNTSTATDWLTEQSAANLPMQYANVNDRHPVVRGIFSYQVKNADTEPTATVKTAAGITVTPKVTILPGDFRTVQMDMRELPDGFYTVHFESAAPVYSDDVAFYLLQQRENPFGIIRLHAKSDDATYNMLDPQGFMLSPVFELRFRNRSTHWRYVGKQFNDASVTAAPLPLTRFGFIENVQVTDKDGHWVDNLPNPAVSIIKTEALTKTTEKNFYSEIHIN
jgi:hypothetical protein